MSANAWCMRMGNYRRVYERWLDGRRINRVSFPAESLFLRLLLIADDFGNLRADAFPLRCQAFPARPEITVEETESWLAELASADLLTVYHHRGDRYVHIPGFETLQPATGKQRRRLSRCPVPEFADHPDAPPDSPPDMAAHPPLGGAPRRTDAHDGARMRTAAQSGAGMRLEPSQSPSQSPSPPSAPPRAAGGGGGGGRAHDTGAGRAELERVWNDNRPTERFRCAGERDSAHLAGALAAVAGWDRAPAAAVDDPVGWLCGQATAYLNSAEAARTVHTLGAWLRDGKWRETPAQWASGDTGTDDAVARAFPEGVAARRNGRAAL